MADELDLDLGDSTTDEQEEKNKVEKRIKSLSEKVKNTSDERDAERARADKEATEKAKALKDADFFKNFNQVTSKYQGASEYQDKIKEKHDAGYEIEDAVVAVLNKEGKFIPPATTTPKESPNGGSATTTVKSGDKSMSEMTTDEKREILEKNLINT